jgi:hypothetical protein
VILADGVVVADGPTRGILTDDALMRANRLELQFGLDPQSPRSHHSPRPGGTRIARTPWRRLGACADDQTPVTGEQA